MKVVSRPGALLVKKVPVVLFQVIGALELVVVVLCLLLLECFSDGYQSMYWVVLQGVCRGV